MQITTSWREEGRLEGLIEGLETALQLKFGDLAKPLIQRMRNYTLARTGRTAKQTAGRRPAGATLASRPQVAPQGPTKL